MEVKRANELGIEWRSIHISTERSPVGGAVWRCWTPTSEEVDGLTVAGRYEVFEDPNIFECIRWRRRLAVLQGDPPEMEPAN